MRSRDSLTLFEAWELKPGDLLGYLETSLILHQRCEPGVMNSWQLLDPKHVSLPLDVIWTVVDVRQDPRVYKLYVKIAAACAGETYSGWVNGSWRRFIRARLDVES